MGGDFITKGKAKSTVILKGDMSFEGNKNIITTLKTSSPRLTLIDLSYNHKHSSLNTAFRLLEIGSKSNDNGENLGTTGLLGGSYQFKIFFDEELCANKSNASVNGKASLGGDNSKYGYIYSDRIIIHSGEKGEHSLLIFSNLNGSSKITYSQNGGTEVSGNVALATVKTDIGMSFKAEGGIDGGEKLNSRLVAVSTDEYGKVNATAGSGSMGTNGGEWCSYSKQ